MKRIYLSLGSNQGDRVANIKGAFERLASAGVEVGRRSALYKTQPVDFISQPWFLNCAAEAETDLMPVRLLGACKEVERSLGRRPGALKGPRPIDIDILLYENTIVHSRELVIPHERMAMRRFVLAPLAEIAPDVCHPVLQRTVQELLHETRDQSAVVKLKGEAQ